MSYKPKSIIMAYSGGDDKNIVKCNLTRWHWKSPFFFQKERNDGHIEMHFIPGQRCSFTEQLAEIRDYCYWITENPCRLCYCSHKLKWQFISGSFSLGVAFLISCCLSKPAGQVQDGVMCSSFTAKLWLPRDWSSQAILRLFRSICARLYVC